MKKNFRKKMTNVVSNAKNFVARKAGWILLAISPIIFAASCNKECHDYTNPDCENYDPCYGKQDIYDGKKYNTDNAAKDVRNTIKDIQATTFGSNWNTGFSNNMTSRLVETGKEKPDINDTSIVAKKTSQGALDGYGNNPQFEEVCGQQIRNNVKADSVYIVTAEDFIKYYNNNQSCIKK